MRSLRRAALAAVFLSVLIPSARAVDDESSSVEAAILDVLL